MPTLMRPGVYVDEEVLPSFVATNSTDSAAVFVGGHTRGPVVPTLIRSWNQFVALYGGFGAAGTAPSYLALAVYNYFNNGGRAAWIVRVTDSTNLATASKILQDSTPANTLQISAINPGAWGNSIYIDITAGSTAGLFDLIVKYGGTASANVVERWTDLNMTPNSPNYAPAIINSLTQGSQYITVTDEGPGTNPVNVTGSQIGSGTGSVPGADGNAASTTDITNALPLLDQIPGQILVNLPAVSDSTVLGAAISYCEGRQNAFLVIDTASGLTPAAAATFAGTLTASSYAAVYYPWVIVSDPASNAPGATRLVPPGAFVLGVIASTDATRGVFKAPAGLQARVSSAVGLERKLTDSDLDTLNNSKVDAIRQIPGAGVVVMGARTLSSVLNTRYVSARRTLIYLRENVINLTQFALFEPNDYVLWNQIRSVLGQFLLSFWQSGGLRGQTSQQAFFVTCDETNNNAQTIANGEVHVEVGVAIQSPAEFIVIKIGQWQGGQQVTELA